MVNDIKLTERNYEGFFVKQSDPDTMNISLHFLTPFRMTYLENEEYLISTICHETIHSVLIKMDEITACTQFDELPDPIPFDCEPEAFIWKDGASGMPIPYELQKEFDEDGNKFWSPYKN